jgi:hypothetical protein
LTSGDIKVNLERRFAMTCHGPDAGQGGLVAWTCTKTAGEVMLRVDFFGTSPLMIEAVTALALRVEAESARSFLGFVATLPYDGAQPDRARTWVGEHIATGGEMMIGVVRFTLSHSDSTYLLRMERE